MSGLRVGLRLAEPTKKFAMKQDLHNYVVSFQTEPYHQGTRYHWIICREHNPDELVSWGYAPTLELAQNAAQKEIQDLSSGESQGGQASKGTSNCLSRRSY